MSNRPLAHQIWGRALSGLSAFCLPLSATVAHANINIELRPATQSAAVNATVNVGVYFVSDDGETNQFCNSANVMFGWDPARLQLLGLTQAGAYPLLVSGFPNDNNVNETNPPQDGTGYWLMLAQIMNPVPATPEGTLLTTFQFRALTPACNGTTVQILPSAGNPPQNTTILSGPAINVTGTFSPTIVTIFPKPDLNNDNVVNTADVPLFVDVLLGLDTDPLRVARSDVNCDGQANGLDIDPFVAVLLGP